MKTEYKVKSERYGYTHSFVQAEDNKYNFVPEEDWMPIYITGDGNGGIAFIDTEGGPCIGIGFKTNEIEVVDLKTVGNTEIFILKEIGD